MLTFSSKSRSRRRANGRTHSSSFAPLDGEPVDSALPADEASMRRGWHDSSMDLRRGLTVTEDVGVDTIPMDLEPPRRR